MGYSADWAAGRPEDDPHALRNCLGNFATGVTVVTYATPDGPRGLTVNSFTAVSLDPPLVLICLDKRSKAVARLPQSRFAINVLDAGQTGLAKHFAGQSPREPLLAWHYSGAVPSLDGSMARLLCEPWSSHDAGDHIIVLGRVTVFSAQAGGPLCFFRGEFRTLYPSQSTLIHEKASR